MFLYFASPAAADPSGDVSEVFTNAAGAGTTAVAGKGQTGGGAKRASHALTAVPGGGKGTREEASVSSIIGGRRGGVRAARRC